MFNHIFIHELKYWLKKPNVYIYFIVFFAMAFLAFTGSAGLFDPPSSNPYQKVVNSPSEINYVMHFFNKFFLFLLPAVVGATIYKDFKSGIYSVMYSFPLKRWSYLLGKFTSSMIVALFISFSVGLAIFVGENMPGLDPSKIGPMNIGGYIQAYALYTIPNLIICGAIVFSVVAFFRNIYAGFMTVVLVFIIQSILENIFAGNNYMIALTDPLGQSTSQFLTKNWNAQAFNTAMLPSNGVIIYNRILWLGLGVLVFVLQGFNFHFRAQGITSLFKNFKGKRVVKSNFDYQRKVVLPIVIKDYSGAQQLKSIWRMSMFHIKSIVKGWMFLILVGLGLLSVVFILGKVTNISEMAPLPMTRIMLGIPSIFFKSIILLMTFLYSGMLVHNDRTHKVNQLVDTTPVTNLSLVVSKVLAIAKMQLLLLSVMLVAGVCLQVYNGFYDFDFLQYFYHLYIIDFSGLFIWACAAVFFHSLLPNVYLGLFVLVIGWIGLGGLPQVGIDEKLVLFNGDIGLLYTDLNEYGTSLKAFFLLRSYWFVFGVMLLVVSYLAWIRGMPSGIRERVSQAGQRWTKQLSLLVVLLFSTFIGLGFIIFKEERKTSEYTEIDDSTALNNFKKEFEIYKNLKQPRIAAVKMKMDLYPENQEFTADVSYRIVNKTNKSLDTLMIKAGFDENTVIILPPESEVIKEDTFFQFSLIKLKHAIGIGDTMTLDFRIKNKPNLLFEKRSNVLKNGSFIKSDILPRFGYFLNAAIYAPDDTLAKANNYQSIDADYVNYEAVISTSGDQIAIAPGYLIREWEEKGRKFFHYKTDQDIKFGFGINSGRYELVKEKWQDINLEIYHHKGHGYTTKEIMAGLKGALEYNTTYFSPYQHKEVRVIEFPHSEGSFATTMANSIQTSEIRFTSNTDVENNKIDLAFYVHAHELTHQWWGNQIMPGNSKGAVMISESITEYITLQIYKRHYGEAIAMQFLKKQRSRYLNGRGSKKESPLYLVAPEDQYISYGKGAIVMNAMAQHIGEEAFNRILKEFLDANYFKGQPYPTSIDFIELLEKRIPDSLQYMIEDNFKTVSLCENSLTEIKRLKVSEDDVEIEVTFIMVKKTMAINSDTMVVADLNDFIELGIYDGNDKLLQLEKVKVVESINSIIIKTGKDAKYVVLDPRLMLIETNIDDNKLEISLQ